jgi:DNA-binding transcriptional MerR regulator
MEKMLPAIPAKRYFTIGEVSDLCGVKPYVLRYWEQEFTQLKPMKRRGNRRYYQHHEVLLIRRIRDLLYDQGFTIIGARNRLLDMPAAADAVPPAGADADADADADEMAELDDADDRSANVVIATGRSGTIEASVALAAEMSAKATARSPVLSSPLVGEQLRNELLSIRALLNV